MIEHAVTILVVGAGKTGAQVLRQLFKNPSLRVMTVDPRDEPHAITQGILQNVDFRESLTPLTIDAIVKQARPDLILLTGTAEDMGLGEAAGVDVLSAALRDEIATIADVPVIEVAPSAA